jgi:uncharacterized repeat protein (TIGR03847 family)
MSASFELAPVDRLTVGTVGPAGKRTFYLQARQADQLVTLKLEKQQVGALAEALTELLDGLPALGPLPPIGPPPADADLGLEEPVLAEWPVGAMRIDYDRDTDQVVLVAEEVPEVDEEGEAVPTGGLARFAASRAQVAALARRGAALVTAGRPPCPLCGYPLDPEGHSCPRTNGHRPPTL